ncbi:aldo/keto reductase [Streptomyces sp. NPDC046915]|uniref:aldo/keto reductase n=1 Tax=Streptomyces sp. NPDC046915 TaxID=3155257 RepID=UPI0033D79F4C
MSTSPDPRHTSTGPADTLPLRDGVEIPVIGLGVFRSPAGRATQQAVIAALDAGYRHIDTAAVYGNEADVGHGLRASGLDRDQVFITTKLWNADHGYQPTLDAFERSRRQLGVDHIDLYLVHWPVPGTREETWRAMEHLLETGKARAIGVSNYMAHHLEELLGYAQHLPSVNQFEISPYNFRSRADVVDLSRKNGIQVEAYSPLTKGRKLDDPPLVRIAEAHGCSTAQVLIRWALQQGLVVLPKSTHADRIAGNADVFGFALTEDEMETLDALDENLVTAWDPTTTP